MKASYIIIDARTEEPCVGNNVISLECVFKVSSIIYKIFCQSIFLKSSIGTAAAVICGTLINRDKDKCMNGDSFRFFVSSVLIRIKMVQL